MKRNRNGYLIVLLLSAAVLVVVRESNPARADRERVTLVRTPDGGIQPQVAVDRKDQRAGLGDHQDVGRDRDAGERRSRNRVRTGTPRGRLARPAHARGRVAGDPDTRLSRDAKAAPHRRAHPRAAP